LKKIEVRWAAFAFVARNLTAEVAEIAEEDAEILSDGVIKTAVSYRTSDSSRGDAAVRYALKPMSYKWAILGLQVVKPIILERHAMVNKCGHPTSR
jgi:hypothetical protein